MPAPEFFEEDFHTISELVGLNAQERPDHAAFIQDERQLTWAQADALCDRIAAALQRDGLNNGDVIAICATTSIEYAVAFLGALRAGVAVSPLAPSSTPEQLAGMVEDCGAKLFFVDAAVAAELQPVADRITAGRVALDDTDVGRPWTDWLAEDGATPQPVIIDPQQPFNIIYSSGTTGAPKGIVQPHIMRWYHVRRGGYFDGDAVTMISTPLYSNTTLVSFFPTVARGGTLILMGKFDVVKFLDQAQTHSATHAMLVPVQYKRLMEHEGFDACDLSAFKLKLCTSAPFKADLKADILKRWPGGLVEYYGMTEGGGTCILECHTWPDKLATVGQPAEGHDIRLIDEDGAEVAQGEIGEIVGHSAAIMKAYHNQPDKTAQAEWRSPDGKRFIRTGDVGRFDEDGFLTLMDRKKDMIISGGFNIYPSDLEAVLFEHPDISDCTVVGVTSGKWGETPVGYVVLKKGASATPDAIREWMSGRVGKTQRLSDLVVLEAIPRSHIGKVMKKELREAYSGPASA